MQDLHTLGYPQKVIFYYNPSLAHFCLRHDQVSRFAAIDFFRRKGPLVWRLVKTILLGLAFASERGWGWLRGRLRVIVKAFGLKQKMYLQWKIN